jgi:hypothetical protein
MLETVVRPGLAYALHLAPYTLADIHTLDKLLARTAKRAFGPPASGYPHGRHLGSFPPPTWDWGGLP